MRLKLFFIILLYFFCLYSLSAQSLDKKITITGAVLDSENRPIVDAIIMIDDQKTSSKTDSEGKFKVRVKPNASKIGIFTFGNGYFEERIGGRTLIDISFKIAAFKRGPDWNIAPGELEVNGKSENISFYRLMGLQGKNTAIGEELVDIGYAQIKKKYLTTDISFIDGTKKKYASYSSVYDMIQREVSGVMIFGKKIIIQGASNITGSVGPLVIVDGVSVSSSDLDYIAPSSVESISVLKGTAAAIYGSRGYGGAIIIKTRTW
jgi:TonB-dependent SusC/RagA subfamily outer membrane receptor